MQATEVYEARMATLGRMWANLKAVLSGDNECFATQEWKDLDGELGSKGPGGAEAEKPVEDLPKAIPDSFPGDPPAVVRGKIVKSYLNKRLFGVCILSAQGRMGDTRNLWVGTRTMVKVGWTMYMKPNPSPSEEGYVLHGEYNRYGDRLR